MQKRDGFVMKCSAKNMALAMFSTMFLASCGSSTPSKPKTKASQSSYNSDIMAARTSKGLSNADLAWHALNTYGWDCSEVVKRGSKNSQGYFLIECSSGKKFRVYPRSNAHPRVTNSSGGYS